MMPRNAPHDAVHPYLVAAILVGVPVAFYGAVFFAYLALT